MGLYEFKLKLYNNTFNQFACEAYVRIGRNVCDYNRFYCSNRVSMSLAQLNRPVHIVVSTI